MTNEGVWLKIEMVSGGMALLYFGGGGIICVEPYGENGSKGSLLKSDRSTFSSTWTPEIIEKMLIDAQEKLNERPQA
jgi:hypothetical protein